MFATYATLNKIGREKFEKIFPEGKVPLFTILSKQMTIAGITDHFYFADYNQFSNDQKRLLAKFMNDERGIPKHRVPECLELMKYKVPLSARFVDTVFEFSPRPDA
jgi:hypothetical protein